MHRQLQNFPCGICGVKCTQNCIECNSCKNWFHSSCRNMSKKDLSMWGEEELKFYCQRCSFVNECDRTYDFEKALNRIVSKFNGSTKKLEATARNEQLLLQKNDVQLPTFFNFTDYGLPDNIAHQILQLYHPLILLDHIPLEVSGDGNCLFRAVSRGLFGTECHHLHIRLLTSIEVAMNKKLYDVNHKNYHDIFKDIRLVHANYKTLLKETSTPGSWSEILTIAAISAALDIGISSYCPPTFNRNSISEPLTKDIYGRNVRRTIPTCLTLMWTMVKLPNDLRDFVPNHFVVLQKEQKQNNKVIDVDCVSEANLLLAPFSTSSPIPGTQMESQKLDLSLLNWSSCSSIKRKGYREAHSIFEDSRPISRNESNAFNKGICDIESPTSIPDKLDDNSTAQEHKTKENATQLLSSFENSWRTDEGSSFCLQFEKDFCDVSKNSKEKTTDTLFNITSKKEENDESIDGMKTSKAESSFEKSNKLSRIIPEGGEKLPLGPRSAFRFLNVTELVSVLKKPSHVFQEIPRGVKENVYFIVDNQDNLERRAIGERNQFWDDCGSWMNDGSCNKTHFLKLPNGSFKKIVEKSDRFFLERQKNNKTIFISLDPQPNPCDILILYRYYVKHKEGFYEKRVSTINFDNSKTACYEYRGQFPGRILHGNSKQLTVEYIRLKPDVMERVKQNLKRKSVTEVYHEEDEINGPTQIKQVKNAKYRQKRKEEPLTIEKENFVDQLAAVEEMQNSESDFVQLVIRKLGKVPCIIVYTEQQISDVVRFCCSGPMAESTILGVDKTYNLCDLHVTVTCFKNLSLKRRNTMDCPLFFGPIFLHGNSDKDTFFTFFHHLAGKLQLSGAIRQPITGSDDEKAIRVAVAKAFPESSTMSCTRHLKKNLIAFLQEKIGKNYKERKVIVQKIFGDQGAVKANDWISFEYRMSEAKKAFPSDAQAYFEKIKDALEENFKSSQTASFKGVTPNWTNNNCESLNHVIKQKIQWKKRSLVEIIIKLRQLVNCQYNEVKKALVGYGSFELHEEFKRFKLTPEAWDRKGEKEKKKFLQKFQQTGKAVCPQLCSSTDRRRKAIAPKNKGKKPGQKKRHRTAKTRSIS